MRTFKQIKDDVDNASTAWFIGGMHEADDNANGVYLQAIKDYFAIFPNAQGYNFHDGIVPVNLNDLRNFCCEYVINGTKKNLDKIKKAKERMKENWTSETFNNYLDTIENADGIFFSWS